MGKVYGVPCYQFLGGKYRDQVRIYADTPTPDEPTPEAYAERVLGRKTMGLTFIKFDIGPRILLPTCPRRAHRQRPPSTSTACAIAQHGPRLWLWASQVTDKGIALLGRDRRGRARGGRAGISRCASTTLATAI